MNPIGMIPLGAMLIRTISLAAVALLIPYAAGAECIGLPPALVAKSAAVVFSGTVTKVDRVDASEWSRQFAQFVTFDVDRVWKGRVRRQFDVYSFTRTPEPYPLRVGTRYLVFAHTPTEQERVDLNLGAGEAFVIGQCGDGTTEFPVPPEDLAGLGPGITPRP